MCLTISCLQNIINPSLLGDSNGIPRNTDSTFEAHRCEMHPGLTSGSGG